METAQSQTGRISDVVLEWEAAESGESPQAIQAELARRLQIMRESVEEGLYQQRKSMGGLVGGGANLLEQRVRAGRSLLGPVVSKSVARALAVSECNAAMGRIVAAPTAGSCGILPGTLITIGEELKLPDDELIRGLLTAAGIGLVVAWKTPLSGAAGGCQLECGVATGMAAGAAVEMAGGTPAQVGHAVALALKNLLAMPCDPVAGLVEVPCAKRNAICAGHAIMAADMALAGVRSFVPVDEVIDVMVGVSRLMPIEFRETALGGLADTKTARDHEKTIFGGLKAID